MLDKILIVVLFFQLSKLELRKGRDQLMWILLQFISGSIQKNPVSKSQENFACNSHNLLFTDHKLSASIPIVRFALSRAGAVTTARL